MAIIGPLLPDRYSPLRISGDGNQKAYLTRIDRALFLELQRIGNFEANKGALTDTGLDLIEKIETQIEDDLRGLPIDLTEIEAVIKARKGQGKFRRNVEQLESRCRITGLADKRLLIASHMKPWRVCGTAAERLDGANGLLLAPHIDRLFDLGLLTFTQTGRVILSETLKQETIECLGV
jgi:putative restriction endonuclease